MMDSKRIYHEEFGKGAKRLIVDTAYIENDECGNTYYETILMHGCKRRKDAGREIILARSHSLLDALVDFDSFCENARRLLISK